MLVAIAASIISVFFYVRVIRVMFFSDPVGEPGGRDRASPLTTVDHRALHRGTLVLGIVPGPVLDLAAHAGDFIR